MFIPTEPGSEIARVYGCTCPTQRRKRLPGGGLSYRLADDCPVHPRAHAYSSPGMFDHARNQEAHQERRRAA